MVFFLSRSQVQMHMLRGNCDGKPWVLHGCIYHAALAAGSSVALDQLYLGFLFSQRWITMIFILHYHCEK